MIYNEYVYGIKIDREDKSKYIITNKAVYRNYSGTMWNKISVESLYEYNDFLGYKNKYYFSTSKGLYQYNKGTLEKQITHFETYKIKKYKINIYFSDKDSIYQWNGREYKKIYEYKNYDELINKNDEENNKIKEFYFLEDKRF